MGMIVRSCDVDWWTTCPSDARFNIEGVANGLSAAEAAIDVAVRAKAAEFGVEPPSDIETHAVKR